MENLNIRLKKKFLLNYQKCQKDSHSDYIDLTDERSEGGK